MTKLKIATDYTLFVLLIVACYIGYCHAEGIEHYISVAKGSI